MKIAKLLLVVIPLLVFCVTSVHAGTYSLNINRVNYFYDDDPTWNASTIYYPKSNSTFRDYREYNIQLWGWTPETLQPVATHLAPNPEPVNPDAATYQMHMFDQFTTSTQIVFPINTYGGVTYSSGLGLIVSNQMVGGEFVYYQDSTGQGNPNNKWPYTRPEYVYNTRSFEVYDTPSGTDAFIATTVGGTKPAIWVSDVSEITSLTDYILEYNGTTYDVYAVTSWTNDGTKWVANHSTTSVATLTPGVDNTFNGITMGITAGTAVPAVAGDKFLLRAHGTVSELDSIIVLSDVTHHLTDMTNMNLAVINRTYSYTVSYLDATIIQDIEVVNTKNQAYTNFYYGYVSRDTAAGWQSDTTRYYPSRNAIMKYDYNGRKDSGTVAEGASSATQGDWHGGEYGSLAYAIYMVKIMQPLSYEGLDQSTVRFTYQQGMGTQNAALDLYFGDPYTGMSYPGKEITCFASLPGTVNAANMYTTAAGFYGVKLETQTSSLPAGHNSSSPDYGTWWEASIRSTSMWGLMTNGIKAAVWNPNVIDNASHYWWANNANVKGYGMVHSKSWVLPVLPAFGRARMVFANSFAENKTDGWANGRNPEVGADLAMTKLWNLAAQLDELFASGMAPALVPVDPTISRKLGYSEFTDETLDANNNREYQIEWGLNSETHPMNQFGPSFRTKYYELTEFNGKEFKPMVRFLAAKHPDFNLAAKLTADQTAITTLEQSLLTPPVILPPHPVTNRYITGTYFDRDERHPDVLWLTTVHLSAVVPLDTDGNIIRDMTQTLRVGLRFAPGTTTFNEAAFIGYVFENRNKTFGYAYRVTLQAINGGDLASSISGDNNFEIIPAAKMLTSGIDKVIVVPNPLIIGTVWDKKNEVTEIKFNHVPPTCTIKIFNVVGDIIRVIEHTDGTTQQKWDLLTKYNQEVSPGLYIYVITDDNGNKSKGTFSIVR